MARNMEALRMSPSQHLLLYPFLQNQILDSRCHLVDITHRSCNLEKLIPGNTYSEANATTSVGDTGPNILM